VKVHLEYQDQFGKWLHYSTMNHQPSEYKSAQTRARSTGKRHRLVDDAGTLLDLVNP